MINWFWYCCQFKGYCWTNVRGFLRWKKSNIRVFLQEKCDSENKAGQIRKNLIWRYFKSNNKLNISTFSRRWGWGLWSLQMWDESFFCVSKGKGLSYTILKFFFESLEYFDTIFHKNISCYCTLLRECIVNFPLSTA